MLVGGDRRRSARTSPVLLPWWYTIARCLSSSGNPPPRRPARSRIKAPNLKLTSAIGVYARLREFILLLLLLVLTGFHIFFSQK